MRSFLLSLRLVLVSLLLCGLAYPLLVLAIAQLVPWRARGSLVVDPGGGVIGSELIGQAFRGAAYLQPRPSAAGAGYDSLASGGSNLGPTSRKLRERVEAELERLLRENPEAKPPVPVELVTTSGSGLDPHLSPKAARWQAPRIARARGVPTWAVEAVIDERVARRTLGFLGEDRVNVLAVNLELDRRFGRASPR
ncbi:potassium-transporting ATPase subunit KdpC [Vulgatibacter incomptus]|uniref:Potassium-transporting ATPase KdpC subunit n=1 Tax=Vulgatibacter incomptus TaxID=1391653 RepID=A0A0K1P895_9BACT|nr:potassium-transporting ATPase subunit KdpC [Vulgatibacter incomptus]AKU89748.1 Potassium-transporting ATPase C chain [Vulgatibacter incomptus]